jgi:MFS family permease
MAVSSISGPVLAGFLLWLDPFGLGWRAVFLINVVIGAVLYPLGARVLAGILGGLIMAGEHEQGWMPVVAIAAGLAVTCLFALRQLRSPAPFLIPSLFRVRSFVAGLTVGFAFFAAVTRLLYATSLYLHFGRGLGPLPTAALMAPLSIGIITASFSARGLVGRLGRRLVALGLTVMGAGTASYLAVILLAPGAIWALLFPLLACGLGMGGCFGSVFSVALGDVRPDQAGSASGTLNAVQQIANAAGAALISAAYLAAAPPGTGRDAVAACLAIVLVITALSLAALPLLPRRAATDTH